MQYLFDKDEIIKFDKKTIIDSKEAFKKIQIFDVRVLQQNKIRDYKIEYFYNFVESREPEQKLIYFKEKKDGEWIKIPQECTLPLISNSYFSEGFASFCDIQYVNGQKTAVNLAHYFFSTHDIIEINDEDQFEIINENLQSLFFNKTQIVQEQIIENINQRTAQEYRNQMYCYLQSIHYDQTDYEDVCYKKGFVIEMRNWLTKYAKKAKEIVFKKQIKIKI